MPLLLHCLRVWVFSPCKASNRHARSRLFQIAADAIIPGTPISTIFHAGEMGRLWYESGKYLSKKNTFTDFIACAEHLVALKYTSPERLCIEGRSGGGGWAAAASTRSQLSVCHLCVATVLHADLASVPSIVPACSWWPDNGGCGQHAARPVQRCYYGR